MKKYKIIFSENAIKDIFNLFDYIETTCRSPETAKVYVYGLRDSIKKLEFSAESFAVQNHKSFSKYGYNVHRLNYRKMTVIFTLHNDIAYIHRIISSALIIQI